MEGKPETIGEFISELPPLVQVMLLAISGLGTYVSGYVLYHYIRAGAKTGFKLNREFLDEFSGKNG